jgi:hypothetical protein
MISKIIIYFIGVVLSSILLIYIRNKVYSNSWFWVVICLLLSFGSWITLGITILLIIILYLYAYFDSDPPDWI